jgi:hypothetical protein
MFLLLFASAIGWRARIVPTRCSGFLRTSRFHFVSLGYPQGNFGQNVRKPRSETTFLNRWSAAVPWE